MLLLWFFFSFLDGLIHQVVYSLCDAGWILHPSYLPFFPTHNYYMLGLPLIVQYNMNYISRCYSHLRTLVSKLVHVSLYIRLSLVMVPSVVLSPAFVRMHPTMIHLLWMLCLLLSLTMAYPLRYLDLFPSWVDNNGRHLFQPSFHMLGIRLS